MSNLIYKLNPMPARIPQDKLDRLAKLETATIGHFYHFGFAAPAIQPVLTGKVVASTVATLAIPGLDSTLLHHCLSSVGPGYFLAVDRLGDTKYACWGGGVTRMAAMMGLDGGCVDGPHTDTAEIAEQDFAMWSRGASPVTTRLYNSGGGFNVPVSIGGAAVLPGYAVLADDSGVLFIAPEDLDEVLAEGETKTERGRVNEAKITGGTHLGQMSGATKMVEAKLGQ
ncbi:RraA family protein [Salipiger marinus]|mgnify:FL=1|jgi:4-hydroxy-4-methyl-2-oxoglutarate aldolase|uniref:Putative 4-hydroxy-4-methyl-2-oxoglutarate aldolase n=1 Tax=Salipiger marinus TaxID=555512 RepID=A0A1G8MIC6_9RHOB|nr:MULTISPECIES: RraA family protein [Salipiger]MCD1617619.1 RraA family protein [Salipiger manganoxidans]MEB3419573.1 RraA family protein [Salipiger manganoxidans]SDI67585.1 Regulator of RNase E activity RraA [Salipiger marinus]